MPQKFWETTMAFGKKILEKNMNGSETWDRFTLGTRQAKSWFIKPKLKLEKKKIQNVHKNQISLHIQLDKTLKYD